MKNLLLIFILIFSGAGATADTAVPSDGYAVYANGDSKNLYKVKISTHQDKDSNVVHNVVWLEGPLKDYNSDIDVDRIYYSNIAYAGVKAGDDVYLHSLQKAKVLGVNNFNLLALEIESGEFVGQRAPEFKRPDLAVTSGCSQKWCVGEMHTVEISIKDQSPFYGTFRLVGLETNGKFVGLSSDEKTGYYDIDPSDEVIVSGCSQKNICVGKTYYLIDEKAFVKVLDLTNDGQVNDQFLTGPKKGTNALFTSEHISLEKSCQDGFCVGETYYGSWKNSTQLILLGISSDKSQIIYSAASHPMEDEHISTLKWLRKNNNNCTAEGDICLGDRVNFNGDGTVAGIQSDNALIINRDSDAKYFYDVDRKSIHKLDGCDAGKKICVGQFYYVGPNYVKSKALSMTVDGRFSFIVNGRTDFYGPQEIRNSGCAKSICHESDFK